jgi:hypothetical protein
MASPLLQQGESLVSVKDQDGAPLAITVDLYRHPIPGRNRQVADRLDERVTPRLGRI